MNRSTKLLAAALLVIAAGLLAPSALAQKGGKGGAGGCCDHCGGHCDCCVTCVLECTEKTIEVPCWKCECEDFCLPGPCKLGCKNCVNPCCGGEKGGGKDGSCGKGGCLGGICGKLFAWRDECPGCPTHHHRKKLFLRIEEVKIPTYKWVVSDCCDKCSAKIEGAEIGPDEEVPPPPPVDAAAVYKYRVRGEAVEARSASHIPVGQRVAEIEVIAR